MNKCGSLSLLKQNLKKDSRSQGSCAFTGSLDRVYYAPLQKNHQLKDLNHGKQQMLGRQLKSYDNLEIQLSLFKKQEELVIFLLPCLTPAINLVLSSLSHQSVSEKKPTNTTPSALFTPHHIPTICLPAPQFLWISLSHIYR